MSPQRQYEERVTCEQLNARPIGSGSVPSRKVTACDRDGVKYLMGATELLGTDLAEANAKPDPHAGGLVVTLQFGDDGAQLWADMTEEAASTAAQVAILVDTEVVSAPQIIEGIPGGTAQITANFAENEATQLALWLNSDRLLSALGEPTLEVLGTP